MSEICIVDRRIYRMGHRSQDGIYGCDFCRCHLSQLQELCHVHEVAEGLARHGRRHMLREDCPSTLETKC